MRFNGVCIIGVLGFWGWAAINARHALLIEHLFYMFWRIRLGPSPSMGLAHSCPPRQAKPRLIAPTRVPFLTNLFYFPQLLIHTAEFDFYLLGMWTNASPKVAWPFLLLFVDECLYFRCAPQVLLSGCFTLAPSCYFSLPSPSPSPLYVCLLFRYSGR